MNKLTSRDRHLLKKYGITSEQYEDIYRRQKGCCRVCGRHASKFKCKLAVDHDHFTGELRGLLCGYCNRYVVGRYRKDKGADLLLAAHAYLTGEYTGWIVPKKNGRKKKKRSLKARRLAQSQAR